MHPIISNLNTRTSDTAVLVLLQPTKGGPYCTGVNITGANLWYPPHPPQQAALDINTKINLGPPDGNVPKVKMKNRKSKST